MMGAPHVVLRGEIYTARLDPTEGSELQKTRPCLVVSNDIDNRYSPVVLVVPLTEHKQGRIYPSDVALTGEFFAVGAPFRWPLCWNEMAGAGVLSKW